MNIRIVLFEDNNAHAKRILQALQAWGKKNAVTIKTVHYSTPIDFDIATICSFDCVLLDIKMPGIDGMQFAHEIRELNHTIPIIFISDYTEYGLEGYEVGAFRFINKNDKQFAEKFELCMNNVLQLISSNSDETYTVKQDNTMISIKLRDIIRIDCEGHYIYIKTENSTYTERKTLSDISKELSISSGQFVQCSRSCILNITYAFKIGVKEVTLTTGETIALSKGCAKDVSQAFLRYH